MKKTIYLFACLFAFLMCHNIQAQTTVVAGNWSSPTTWGGAPPMGSGTVVINHAVTLDMDYSHSSGSITIGSSGSLNSTNPMRGFALNYPSGSASLTVNGTLNIPRVPLMSGTVINNGTFQIDSLLNAATLTNGNNGIIHADQFMNNTAGNITNNGSIFSINFLNIETVSNAGSISANDFTNSKSFTNTNTGTIDLTNDFFNADTLASPAIFTNNGIVNVANDWHNDNQINGSGRFCIHNNTWNSGAMTGTFDFCDQTGGNIDLNTGTIAGTITYCTFTCTIGMSEQNDNSDIRFYPNPVSSVLSVVTSKEFRNANLSIYNSFGQEVMIQSNLNGQEVTLDCGNLAAGIYFIRMTESNNVVASEKIVIQK
ncbi:MAG: T9SS type A sorting domain-containing protein [Bacteroidota bacterium]